MANVKLGNKIFKDVDKIKVNTDDGNTVVFSEPGTVSEVMKLNIAYGDTAPADTSKLWVKAPQATKIDVKSSFVQMPGEVEEAVEVMPYADGIDSMSSAVVGRNIYLFGGYCPFNGKIANVRRFHTDTKEFYTLASSLLTSASNIASAVIGKKVYLFGGHNAAGADLSDICVYDTFDNTMERLYTKLPMPLRDISAAAVGTDIYLFGGINDNTPQKYIYKFNTETMDLSQISASLPTARTGIVSQAVGAKVYLFGGYNGNGNGGSDQICVFDAGSPTPKLSVLSTILPTDITDMAAVTIGAKIYLFGGESISASLTDRFLSKILVFDTETNRLSALNCELPVACSCLSAEVVGSKVYLFGGRYKSGHSLSNINEFTVSTPLPKDNLIIETDIAKNLVNLVSNDIADVEIGIKNVYIGNSEGYAEKVPAYLYKNNEWAQI